MIVKFPVLRFLYTIKTKTFGFTVSSLSIKIYIRKENKISKYLLIKETYMQVRKQQLELDMEQQTGSK